MLTIQQPEVMPEPEPEWDAYKANVFRNSRGYAVLVLTNPSDCDDDLAMSFDGERFRVANRSWYLENWTFIRSVVIAQINVEVPYA